MANRSGKQNQANTGSKSNNFETNTKTEDLVLAQTAFLPPPKEAEPTEEQIQDAIVYSNEVTSIDFMMPEDERKIIEKNLNLYGNTAEMKKVLNVAKSNKILSEDIRNLEIASELGDIIQKVNGVLGSDKNIAVLDQYIENLLEKGDVAKAYKEAGLMNKAMMDARDNVMQKMRANKSGKTAKIALKFTNDSGEDFQLGAEVDV